MPTITTTPVQVASDPQYRMNNSELLPFIFEIGSDTYQVFVAAQDLVATHTIGIFKRATSDVGGAWTQLDSSNQPDPGNQQAAVFNFCKPQAPILIQCCANSECRFFRFGCRMLMPGANLALRGRTLAGTVMTRECNRRG